MPYKLHSLKYIQAACARVLLHLKVIVTDCAQTASSVAADIHCTMHVLSPDLQSVTFQVLTYKSLHTKFVDVCDALSYQMSDS
jgi:hypothetical protein